MEKPRFTLLGSILIACAIIFLTACASPPSPTPTASAPTSTRVPPTATQTPGPTNTATRLPPTQTDIPAPSATAVPTLPPLPAPIGSSQCPNTLPSMLMPGRRGRVDNSGTSTNRVRNQPGLTGTDIIGELQPGEFFDVLAGPECLDNMAWFQVRSDAGLEGWMGEGTADGYWVMPIAVDAVGISGAEVTLPGLTIRLPVDFGSETLLNTIPYDPELQDPPFRLLTIPGYSNTGKTASIYIYDVDEMQYYDPDSTTLLNQVRVTTNLLLTDLETELHAPGVLHWLRPEDEIYLWSGGPFEGGFGYRTVQIMSRTDGAGAAAPYYVFYGFTADMRYFIYAVFEVDVTFGTLAQATVDDFAPSVPTLDGMFTFQAAMAAGPEPVSTGDAANCPGAPPFTLAVDEWVRVNDDPPIPSNLRSQPSSGGEILGSAELGSNLLVIGGPECANGYAWWQVRTAAGLEGWTIEGDAESYWLVEPISIWTTLPNPLNSQDLRPLLAWDFRVSVPSVVFQDDMQIEFFPMATPLPTLAPNILPDDPRALNPHQYRHTTFDGSGGQFEMTVNTIPVTPNLPLNWETFKSYSNAIAAMTDSGNVLSASLDPFLGLEGGGAPVKIITAMKALEFTGGRGVRYLVGTVNGTPVMNPLYYIFQGVSDDGEIFIYVFIPVRSPYLLLNVQTLQDDFGPFVGWDTDPSGVLVQASYDAYDERIEALLSSGVLTLYPQMELMDNIVESLILD